MSSAYGKEITAEDSSTTIVYGPLHRATADRVVVCRRHWQEIDPDQYEWDDKRAVHKETGEELRIAYDFPYYAPESTNVSHWCIRADFCVLLHRPGPDPTLKSVYIGSFEGRQIS